MTPKRKFTTIHHGLVTASFGMHMVGVAAVVGVAAKRCCKDSTNSKSKAQVPWDQPVNFSLCKCSQVQ